MEQEKESAAEVEKFREDCLSTAAFMLAIADRVSEEDVPQRSRDKIRKVRALVKDIEEHVFKTGTEVTPAGSSQLPPKGDRQITTVEDSQRESN